MMRGGAVPRPEFDVILSAAMKNDAVLIRDKVTKEGVPATHANAVGQSALHIAALWGNVEAVETLLELGANVQAQNSMSGGTPLHMVAQSQKGSVARRLQVIDLLVQAGASLSKPDSFGILPVDCVTEANYDNADDKDALVAKLQPQKPEFIQAIQDRNPDAVQELLSKQPNLSTVSYKGQTPVAIILQDLEQLVATEQQQQQQQQLHRLASMLKTILNAGGTMAATNPTQDSLQQQPPTMIMMESNLKTEPYLYRIVSLLQDLYRSQPQQQDQDECVRWIQDMGKDLVQAGAPVTDQTQSLLHDAARRNQKSLATYLIDTLQVSVNQVGRQGMTPLHFAARSGQVEMVKYLLEKPDINVHATDDRGKTPLDAARVNDKQDVVQLLETYMKDHPSPPSAS